MQIRKHVRESLTRLCDGLTKVLKGLSSILVHREKFKGQADQFYHDFRGVLKSKKSSVRVFELTSQIHQYFCNSLKPSITVLISLIFGL